MKNILQLMLLLALPWVASGQDKFSARIPIAYMKSPTLHVLASGEIWILPSERGKLNYFGKIGGAWHQKNLSSQRYITRVRVISTDTLLGNGYSKEDQKEALYWSGNGGKTWSKVIASWKNQHSAFYHNNQGKIWLGNRSGDLYYSEDYGKTWENFRQLKSKKSNDIWHISFAKDDKRGLLSTTNSVLYHTQDNCKTWEKLPVPLSRNQQIGAHYSKEATIHKLSIIGNFYLIKQGHRVFVSNKSNIDWKILPDAIDFEVTSSGQLYTITQDLHVALHNEALKLIWQSNQHLNESPKTMVSKNEQLFVLTQHKVYQVSPKKFVHSELLINDRPIKEPGKTIVYKGEKYGFLASDILRFDQKLQKWYRWLPIDIDVMYPYIYQNQLIITDRHREKYLLINEQQIKATPYTFPSQLFFPEKNPVVKFSIEQNDFNCSTTSTKKTQKTYVKRGNKFVLLRGKSHKKFLKKMPKNISVEAIHQLVKVMGQSKARPTSMADLEVSPQDMIELKKLIATAERAYKKTGGMPLQTYPIYVDGIHDFSAYMAAVGALPNMPSKIVNQALMTQSGSTSSGVSQNLVTFVFKDQTKLEVSNTDPSPQYLYVPWNVYYQGMPFRSSSIKFGRLLDKLTQGEFFAEPSSKKEFLLLKIMQYYLNGQKLNKK